MMPDLERIYDRAFFAEWGPGHGKYVKSAEIIADILHDRFRPKRYWVSKLAEKGFSYNHRETGRLLTALTGARPPYMWMVEQISIYDRAKLTAGVNDRLPFSVPAPR